MTSPPERWSGARAAAVVLLAMALSGCATSSLQPSASARAPDRTPAAAPRPVVSGMATYRERIALPAGAVFEAVIEDISKAGAPAVELARARSKPAGVPIPFSIDYDPAALDPRARYSVRARILVDGRLWFTSDTIHPVLRNAGDTRVDILMRRVQSVP
jgi:putative lipoprotein